MVDYLYDTADGDSFCRSMLNVSKIRKTSWYCSNVFIYVQHDKCIENLIDVRYVSVTVMKRAPTNLEIPKHT